jgi:spore coat protein CotF
MTLNLTQKEKTLLQDSKNHEEICIKKYRDYAGRAQDSQLKQLFNNYASQEQQHLNTINQILSGQVPSTNQGGQQGQQNHQSQQGTQDGQQGMSQGGGQSSNMQSSSNDKALCDDLLITEKYVSGAYDTAIFEMTDKNVRQALNHIQKEEQQHGEGIFNYMNNKGIYNTQG